MKDKKQKIGYDCNKCDNSWIDDEECFYCDQCGSPNLEVYGLKPKSI